MRLYRCVGTPVGPVYWCSFPIAVIATQAPSMTPRTRTLYAFMGESQQPYQSPAKDLDMLNGHISGCMPHVVGVQVNVLHTASIFVHECQPVIFCPHPCTVRFQ